MTTPTRIAPAGRLGRRPPAPLRAPGADPGRAQAPPPPGPPREPVSFDRVFKWSLLLSVGVHLLILVLSPLFIRIGPPPGGVVGNESAAPTFSGLQGIVPIAGDDAGEPRVATVVGDAPPVAERPTAPSAQTRPPAAAPPRSRAAPGAAGQQGAAADAGANVPRESAGDALRPGFRDSRLWVNPRELRVEQEQSRHERYMDHLQARIDAMNDSTYGRGPNTDWTTTDGKGRRWGISEDGIHLGGITIPPQLIPIPSTGSNQKQEEERERNRQRDEIRRQEAARERERAAEESRKAAATRRRGGGNGGGGGG